MMKTLAYCLMAALIAWFVAQFALALAGRPTCEPTHAPARQHTRNLT